MKLEPRDEKIMRVIYEEQFLLLKTISKYFFRDSFQSASVRILKLIQLKLLRYEILNLPNQPKVARLTPNGVRHSKSISPFSIPQKKKVALSTFTHDALLSITRLELINSFDAQWVPEKAMKAQDFKKIPDGILLFASGRRIAVELENTVKGAKRYEQMWREWEAHDFFLVLYVATTDVVYRALERRMNLFQSSKLRLGLITLEGLTHAKKPHVWTPRGLFPLFDQRQY